jgi:cell division protein FtsB
MDKEAQLRAMREEKHATNSAAATILVTKTIVSYETKLEQEIDQLKARIALLEAELTLRKPRALSATERSRQWRARKHVQDVG